MVIDEKATYTPERDVQQGLVNFLTTAAEDPRLSPVHISLYVGIINFYMKQKLMLPVTIFRRDLMKMAKISSRNTYHKCLIELHRYGYIHYIASYNPMQGSLVYPIKLK